MKVLADTSSNLPVAVAAAAEAEMSAATAGSPVDPALARKVEEAWRVAEDFEAIYLRMMLQTMRKTTMETGLFGESTNAMKVYQSMQDDYLSDQLSRSRQFGMSRMIFDYLVDNSPELKKTAGAVREASRAYQLMRETDGQDELRLLEQPAKAAE